MAIAKQNIAAAVQAIEGIGAELRRKKNPNGVATHSYEDLVKAREVLVSQGVRDGVAAPQLVLSWLLKIV